MFVREYLEQLQITQNRIEAKLDHIEQLDAIVNRITSVISNTTAGSRDPHRKEVLMLELFDLIDSLKEEIADLTAQENHIRALINNMPNESHKLVLERRYINGDEWKNIAEELGCSKRTVYRMHDEALQQAEIQFCAS